MCICILRNAFEKRLTVMNQILCTQAQEHVVTFFALVFPIQKLNFFLSAPKLLLFEPKGVKFVTEVE